MGATGGSTGAPAARRLARPRLRFSGVLGALFCVHQQTTGAAAARPRATRLPSTAAGSEVVDRKMSFGHLKKPSPTEGGGLSQIIFRRGAPARAGAGGGDPGRQRGPPGQGHDEGAASLGSSPLTASAAAPSTGDPTQISGNQDEVASSPAAVNSSSSAKYKPERWDRSTPLIGFKPGLKTDFEPDFLKTDFKPDLGTHDQPGSEFFQRGPDRERTRPRPQTGSSKSLSEFKRRARPRTDTTAIGKNSFSKSLREIQQKKIPSPLTRLRAQEYDAAHFQPLATLLHTLIAVLAIALVALGVYLGCVHSVYKRVTARQRFREQRRERKKAAAAADELARRKEAVFAQYLKGNVVLRGQEKEINNAEQEGHAFSYDQMMQDRLRYMGAAAYGQQRGQHVEQHVPVVNGSTPSASSPDATFESLPAAHHRSSSSSRPGAPEGRPSACPATPTSSQVVPAQHQQMMHPAAPWSQHVSSSTGPQEQHGVGDAFVNRNPGLHPNEVHFENCVVTMRPNDPAQHAGLYTTPLVDQGHGAQQHPHAQHPSGAQHPAGASVWRTMEENFGKVMQKVMSAVAPGPAPVSASVWGGPGTQTQNQHLVQVEPAARPQQEARYAAVARPAAENFLQQDTENLQHINQRGEQLPGRFQPAPQRGEPPEPPAGAGVPPAHNCFPQDEKDPSGGGTTARPAGGSSRLPPASQAPAAGNGGSSNQLAQSTAIGAPSLRSRPAVTQEVVGISAADRREQKVVKTPASHTRCHAPSRSTGTAGVEAKAKQPEPLRTQEFVLSLGGAEPAREAACSQRKVVGKEDVTSILDHDLLQQQAMCGFIEEDN